MIYGTASYYAHLRFEPAAATVQAAAVDAHRPAEATYLAALDASLGRIPTPRPARREAGAGLTGWPPCSRRPRPGRRSSSPAPPHRTRPTSMPRPATGAFDALRRVIRDLGRDRDDRHDRELGAARPWRRRVPGRGQVADRRRDGRAAPLRRGQRLRRGPGDRHGPVPARARSVRRHRGRGDRRLRDRGERGHRRGPGRRDRGHPPARGGDRRRRGRGLRRLRRPRLRARHHGHGPAGPGRLHARRGDGPAQGPRGQARPARAAPAASGRARPVRRCRPSSTTSRPWRPSRGSSATAPRRSRRSATPDCPGTILVQVRTPAGDGIAEVPLGTPLRDVVALGGQLPAAPLDQGRRWSAARRAACSRRTCSTRRTPSTPLRAAGAHVGSGSVVVADDRACIVDLARLLTRFCAGEACGKTIPCRIGTRRLVEIADRVVEGRPAPDRPDPARGPVGRHRRPPPCATTSA